MKSNPSRFIPPAVDACELPLQNAINFPAANFQLPYFDPQAPAALNYGAIGTTIGHELYHTFGSIHNRGCIKRKEF
jgi:putative endopeptidase